MQAAFHWNVSKIEKSGQGGLIGQQRIHDCSSGKNGLAAIAKPKQPRYMNFTKHVAEASCDIPLWIMSSYFGQIRDITNMITRAMRLTLFVSDGSAASRSQAEILSLTSEKLGPGFRRLRTNRRAGVSINLNESNDMQIRLVRYKIKNIFGVDVWM